MTKEIKTTRDLLDNVLENSGRHHIGKGPNAFAFAFPKKEKLVNSFS
jgi:hypothetical protein